MYERLPYPPIVDGGLSALGRFYGHLLRSKYMAEYMISYAALAGLSDLHALVGLGHEREVHYFILHPASDLVECILALVYNMDSE